MDSSPARLFADRAVLVTGAGHGLGRDFAIQAAAAGARVVVNDIGRSDDGTRSANHVVDEITDAGGIAVASHDSIGEIDGAVAAVERTVAEFGRIDALINNAGIIRDSPFEDQSLDEFDDILAVHLRGAYAATQAAYRHMKLRGYGRLVTITSSSGVFGLPTHSAYGSAKTALVGLTNVVAIEGERHGILANAVLPMATTNPGRTAAAAGLGEILGEASTRMTTDYVTPLVLYLASHLCTDTHGVYSALAGRYGRVATVVADGWVSPTAPSVADIAQHFDQVRDIARHTEPASLECEVRGAVQALERAGVVPSQD